MRGNGAHIQKGAAIATFEDGFYPNRKHGLYKDPSNNGEAFSVILRMK